jgi:uncharacterized membrane protein YphA (DoxX/SURF4 family)
MLNFPENVSIAGGFLLVLANGAGPISLDARRTGDSTNQTTRAERRTRQYA